MDELFFVGVDVSQEVRKLLEYASSNITHGMNANEAKAYNLGVENAISALNAVFENYEDNCFVVNINDIPIPTEFDVDDLTYHLSNKN